MGLEECKKAYEQTSGKASDIARYLGFAGIALIWVFKEEADGKSALPYELHLPATLIVAGLAADLLQYVVHTLMYFVYFRIRERWPTMDNDAEFSSPAWLPIPSWGLWLVKLVLIGAAYWYLLSFLAGRLRLGP